MNATQEQIDSFHQFATERLSNGGADLTMEELFELWRLENPSPERRTADLLAVKAALRDMENGDTGVPFEEFKREFRARHNIPEHE